MIFAHQVWFKDQKADECSLALSTEDPTKVTKLHTSTWTRSSSLLACLKELHVQQDNLKDLFLKDRSQAQEQKHSRHPSGSASYSTAKSGIKTFDKSLKY